MNVFRILRRAMWSIILAACIVVGCLYLAFSQAFLTTAGLTQIVKQSGLIKTVRSDVILPQITTLAQNTRYSGLLDDKTVTDAFNTAVSDDILITKLTPAIDSVSGWLNSKEPGVDFSISLSDLSGKFADELTSKVKAKIATLPACVPGNTATDVENGRCQSPLLSSDMISKEIDDAIKNNPAFGESVTLTPASLPVHATDAPGGSTLPSYLNMFYSATLVLTGIAILIALWLLLKHRLAGIITIGAACVIAALLLALIPTALMRLSVETGNPLFYQITSNATQSLGAILQQQTALLAIGGIAAIILASAGLIILARRHKSHETVQLPTHTPPTKR